MSGSSAQPSPAVKGVSESATDIQLTIPGGYPQDGYLVLARTFYPGWKAKVNGESRPVLRANYAFSAIPLHKGDATVEYYYNSDPVKIGALLSIGGLILYFALIGLAVWQWRKYQPSLIPASVVPVPATPTLPSVDPLIPPAQPDRSRPELLDDDRFLP